MDINDLLKLAGMASSAEHTHHEETCNDCGCNIAEPDTGCGCNATHTHEDESSIADNSDGMQQMIAMFAPQMLNKLEASEEVEEELEDMPGKASTTPAPHEVEPIDASGDTSLRRYLGAAGQPVKVDEVYKDVTVDDLTEAWDSFKSEASIGAPDYNPAAQKYASNREYGMFTPEGNDEVDEIVSDIENRLEEGEFDTPESAIDAAMSDLSNLADDNSSFEEASDTDVRDHVTRELLQRFGRDSGFGEEVQEADTPMMPCPDCDGDGEVEVETYRPQSFSRDIGEIDSHMETCENCNGDGEIEDEDADLDEADVGEGNAYTGALAKAKATGDKEFKVGGKTHKVTETEINESINTLKTLSGIL
jgi:hypothetical protein|tara:strand:- start:4123 stop:5211 length:1089 start_codon:yes stop_codon:yes gene_type:complete